MKFEVPSEGEEKIVKKVRLPSLYQRECKANYAQYEELLQKMTDKFASVVDE
jgi:uncharacterized protein YqiB (DUF1249 family)